MSMRTLELAVLAGARLTLSNPKLKLKDILEWSTGDVKPESDTEVVIRVPNPGVNICVLKTHDKRPA